MGVEVEKNPDLVAARVVDEVVEIIEGSEGGIYGLCVGGVGLNGSKEDGVDAEGLNVVEALGDAVEATTAGGAEVDRVHLVDDGVLPPNVSAHAGADPAGAGEGLGWSRRDKDAGEEKREELAGSRYGHAPSNLRCYARSQVSGIDGLCAGAAGRTAAKIVDACVFMG
jgi:hypothetical protein